MKKITIKPKKYPQIYYKMTISTNPKKYKFIKYEDLGKEYKEYCFSFSLFHKKTEKLKTVLQWLESVIE